MWVCNGSFCDWVQAAIRKLERPCVGMRVCRIVENHDVTKLAKDWPVDAQEILRSVEEPSVGLTSVMRGRLWRFAIRWIVLEIVVAT